MRGVRAAAMAALAAMGIPAMAEQGAPAPPASCRLVRLASLDMDMDATGRITVPIGLNGVEKRMMLDTGASDSILAREVVDELKLKTKKSSDGSYIMGFGGRTSDQVVVISEFRIGALKGENFRLWVMNESYGSAGLLGPDILQSYDLDFDFANAKLNLVFANHCPGKVVYWTKGDYGAFPFVLKGNNIKVQVVLDGKPVNAILDTGAVDTVMSLERAASAFDLKKALLKKSRHYPFTSLSFGAISVGRPAIELVPDSESHLMGKETDADQMIVGMGVLRRLHLYISFKEHMIYLTPATQY